MISVEKLLQDIQRAAAEADLAARSAGTPPAGVLDLDRLLPLLLEGESRRLASEQRLGAPVPRFCIFSVTWECNLSCAGCYASNYTRGAGLSGAEIRRILDEAAGLGSYLFVIVGGEPLLVPNLVEMLAATPGALFFLFTNGTKVDAAIAAAVRNAGNILLTLSVEGDTADTAERRGRTAPAHVEKAIAHLRAAGVPFGFAAMATRRNLDAVCGRPWLDEMWRAGARFGFIIDYVPFAGNLREDYVLTADDLRRKADLVRQRYEEARPLLINFPPDEYAFGTCQAAGTGFLHINADGYVEPCPFSHLAADNLRSKPLAEALASPFFHELRAAMPSLANPEGRCLLHTHAERVRQIAARTGAHVTEGLPASEPKLHPRGNRS